MKKLGVVLGRFAPLHKGHQKTIDKAIADFGINNTLIIVGSSTSYNSRTPFSLQQRRAMIRSVYPDIKVAEINDINPKSEQQNIDTMDVWIKNLKSMQKQFKAEFIFYGGSQKDIEYLSKDFKTFIAVDRNKNPQKISATLIRKYLKEKNQKKLKSLLDNRIITLTLKHYLEFEKQVHIK